MPFKKGQSGNLKGRPPDSASFVAVLRRAAVQEDGKKLRRIADKLLVEAERGEGWAIKELADRLDGKAVQQIIGAGPQGEHIGKLVIEIADPKNTGPA